MDDVKLPPAGIALGAVHFREKRWRGEAGKIPRPMSCLPMSGVVRLDGYLSELVAVNLNCTIDGYGCGSVPR